MKSWGKALLIVVVVGAFLIPTLIATRYVSLWHICQGYVDTVSNLTGFNAYLTTAVAALLFVPFSIGVSWSLSWRRERRRAGEAILLGLFAVYNLGLFAGTRHAYFGFTKGETLKWYALTPDGVQLYDRAGVDPKYGIELKPVTKDVVRQLDLMQKGEFKPIDPSTATLFNPITGEAQAWFYRSSDGAMEFYDKPGFEPRTGSPLQPVTKDVYFEWKKTDDESKRQQAQSEKAEEERKAQEERARQESKLAIPHPRKASREQQAQDPLAASCGGWSYNGYCWYAQGAGRGQSCDAVCSARGGFVYAWDDPTCTVLQHFYSCTSCSNHPWEAPFAPFHSSLDGICWRQGSRGTGSGSRVDCERVCACSR